VSATDYDPAQYLDDRHGILVERNVAYAAYASVASRSRPGLVLALTARGAGDGARLSAAITPGGAALSVACRDEARARGFGHGGVRARLACLDIQDFRGSILVGYSKDDGRGHHRRDTGCHAALPRRQRLPLPDQLKLRNIDIMGHATRRAGARAGPASR